jgi:predicted nucleic acid-binding protein
MKVYLDNCCFNRPYDDQSHLRIRLEAEAKLKIQEETRNGVFELIWSYILDYENSRNPFKERREQIVKWRKYAVEDIVESKGILGVAAMLQEHGLKKIDSLHIACAIEAGSEYFLTTDDGILKRATLIQEIKVTDPIGFIKEVLV